MLNSLRSVRPRVCAFAPQPGMVASGKSAVQDPGPPQFCANSRVQHPEAAEEFNFRGWALRGQFWVRQVLGRRTEMSTYIPSALTIDRKWFVVDASGKTLGRLATEAASILAGKRNPKYNPFLDMGDHVIVINDSTL